MVDAYGAQHAGGSATRLSVAFSLIGPHLAFVDGWTGLEIRAAHLYLANPRQDWPEFERSWPLEWWTLSDPS